MRIKYFMVWPAADPKVTHFGLTMAHAIFEKMMDNLESQIEILTIEVYEQKKALVHLKLAAPE